MAYHDLLDSNPFRLARGKMTQQEIADRLDVTVQYIYRHENGLVNSPSASLCELLGVPPGDFYSWVSAMRRTVQVVNTTPASIVYGVESISNEHPFISFMYAFNRDIAGKLGIATGKKSQQLFNRLLCLHPRVVQQYLSGTGDMSPILQRALSEVGITGYLQEIIEAKSAAFSAEHSHD